MHTTMIPFKFHKGELYTEEFLKGKEEPEESLDELLTEYDEMCKDYHSFRVKLKEMAKPYTQTGIVDGKVRTTIDYDRWEKEDEEGFCAYACGDFNSASAFEMYEYDIDLKIAFMNQRGETFNSEL